MNLWLTDVETPDGHRWEHHVVKMRHLAVVVNKRREVLMMWRHRFITDAWAWELPMGLIEEGETPAEAAAREVLEGEGTTQHLLPTRKGRPSMTAVTVEITRPPTALREPEEVVLLDDLETGSEGAVPGCNDDTPYR